MLDNEPTGGLAAQESQAVEPAATPKRRRAPRKRSTTDDPAGATTTEGTADRTGSTDAAQAADATKAAPRVADAADATHAAEAAHRVADTVDAGAPAADPSATPRKRASRRAGRPTEAAPAAAPDPADPVAEEAPNGPPDSRPALAAAPLFIAPAAESSPAAPVDQVDDRPADEDEAAPRPRRRGRRGRGRGKGTEDADGAGTTDAATDVPPGDPSGAAPAEPPVEAGAVGRAPDSPEDAERTPAEQGEAGQTRRRRRRRRRGEDAEAEPARTDDPPDTVVRVRRTRADDTDDEVRGLTGSARLEAKRQRRRDGREQGRRRPPIITEAEFLARREAVDRVMVVRQVDDLTQIGVLEDGVLVEHYVARAETGSSVGSSIGNVYLGRVQNVLPSMEAAFVDIGKGRNAVLYAGEVNWDASGLAGKPRRIEDALNAGQAVLAQVTKDPFGHKGARLTSQISLPGRFLVYVPEGSMTGISRKLPDTERKRLKDILKRVVPEQAGVIIRTAAEGASEDELVRDVRRLQAQWDDIQAKARKGNPPALLYAEPDLLVRVVRDIFNEDFRSLVVSGEAAWNMIEAYVQHLAPDLVDRLERHTATTDVFAEYRIDEQLVKALDRKVWLPSGGSLVIDRTEAMTVIDVNTGKFTGQGGSLEETVTRNNLEAAEEVVRQLRLRDIGGIVVIDFIDMVLESNRDLVLRRLTECLGRDRTRHQVAEVTSLGLVQMTRKRVGQGLLEVFSEPCEVCGGRGRILHTEPLLDPGRSQPAGEGNGRRRRARRGAEAPAAAASGAAAGAAKVAAAGAAGATGAASSPAAAGAATEEQTLRSARDLAFGEADLDDDELDTAAARIELEERHYEQVGLEGGGDEFIDFADQVGGPAPAGGVLDEVAPLDSSADAGPTDPYREPADPAQPVAEATGRKRRRRAAARPAGPPTVEVDSR